MLTAMQCMADAHISTAQDAGIISSSGPAWLPGPRRNRIAHEGQREEEEGRRRAKAGTVKDLDLARREQPTDRGYFYGGDHFEERLEQIQLEKTDVKLSIGKLATIRAKLHMGPSSPVALTITGLVGTLVFHVTDAPEDAQLGVVLLPFAIALTWRLLDGSRPTEARRRALEQDRTTPTGQDDKKSTPAGAES